MRIMAQKKIQKNSLTRLGCRAGRIITRLTITFGKHPWSKAKKRRVGQKLVPFVTSMNRASLHEQLKGHSGHRSLQIMSSKGKWKKLSLKWGSSPRSAAYFGGRWLHSIGTRLQSE